jgi:hypothetical protein
LLVKASLVDDPDLLAPLVFGSNDELDAIADAILVPAQQAQELLKAASRDTGRVRDGLDRLALERTELPLDVGAQMATTVDGGEAVVEPGEESAEPPAESLDVVGGDGIPPVGKRLPPDCLLKISAKILRTLAL